MITVAEAARRLNTAPSVIYRMIHTGHIAAYQQPGRLTYLVDEQDIETANTPIPVTPPTGASADRVYTAGQTASILCCSIRTVRILVKDGQLTARRNPGARSHLRVYADSVDRYLAKIRAAATANDTATH